MKIHSQITTAGSTVLDATYCSFEVTQLLPCSTYTATLLEYLSGHSKVTVELFQRSSAVISV